MALVTNYYTLSFSLSSGTTLLTSPYWYASLAEMDSPNKSISIAFFCELIDRVSSTAGVEQNSPHFTPGVENDDFYVAITRSQAKAN